MITAQFGPFLELFFPDEAVQLDLDQARFVDKELFADPPMGPGREVDILADVPLRAAGASGPGGAPSATLVAIHIEVQSQHDPEFHWRMLEYYALLCRLRGLPVLPIALVPIADVLGRRHRRRPRSGFERVVQRDNVLDHSPLIFEYSAVTLGALDANAYLARPIALAGALAAIMRRASSTPLSEYKLACLRRIIQGGGVPTDRTRHLLADVVQAYLPLFGQDEEAFDRLLTLPQNQEVRHTMQTWTEQQQAIARLDTKREDMLRVLETKLGPIPEAVVTRVLEMNDVAALSSLLVRAVTASSLEELGLR